MDHPFLFVGTLVALLSVVPLATLAATGSLRDAWEAAKGYAMVWAIIGGMAIVIAAFSGLAWVFSS